MRKCFSLLLLFLVLMVSHNVSAQYTTFTLQTSDMSILQRSMDRQEQRSYEASNAYADLANYIGNIRQQLKTRYWSQLDSIANPYLESVNKALGYGYWGEAIRRATLAKGELANNSEIIHLKQLSKEPDVTTPQPSSIEKIPSPIDGIEFGDRFSEVHGKFSSNYPIYGQGSNWIEYDISKANQGWNTVYLEFIPMGQNLILTKIAFNYFAKNATLAKNRREEVKKGFNLELNESIASNGFKYYYTNPYSVDKIEIGVNNMNDKRYDVYMMFIHKY